jgi:hypothetical protein
LDHDVPHDLLAHVRTLKLYRTDSGHGKSSGKLE